MIPITDVAIRETYYTDSVNLHNLNNKVYYALTSLDERYNQSEQCQTIEVSKPQTIPPTAPVITKGIAETGKNIIEWVSGDQISIDGFIVVRRDAENKEGQKVLRIENPTAIRHEDNDIESGKTYQYQVMVYSTNQQRSPLSSPIKIKSLKGENGNDVVKFDLEILSEGIAIKWGIPYKDVISVSLYKLDATNTQVLYRENLPVSGEFVDSDILQGKTNEYMIVIKAKGHKPITIKKEVAL